jgi:hypothetical protein
MVRLSDAMDPPPSYVDLKLEIERTKRIVDAGHLAVED